MDENTSLISGKNRESGQSANGPGCKVKVAEGAVLLTITLERIAFYSLAGNLVLFLNTNPYAWTSYNAMYALLYFFGISYLMSFFGGLIADTLLGRFKSLLLSLLLYLVGYLLLPLSQIKLSKPDRYILCNPQEPSYNMYNITHGLMDILNHQKSPFDESCSGLMFGVLTLIAIGSGPFRSNIAPFGADQVKGESQQANLTFFNWYYWCVNVGTLVALLVITYVQQHESFYDGYLSALICLGVAAVVFLCGSCSYVYRPRTGSVFKNIFTVLCEACTKCCWRRKPSSSLGDDAIEQPSSCLDFAMYRYGGNFQEGTVNEVKKVLKIICVFLTMVPYWMVYFQMETTFLLQGLHMNLNLPVESANVTVDCNPQNSTGNDDPNNIASKPPKLVAAWLSIFDVIFVIILIPVFDRFIYPRLAKAGRPMGFVLRVSVGMMIAASAVCVAGVVERYRLKSVYPNDSMPCCRHTAQQKIGRTVYNAAEMSVLWQIPQYALIGLSEVFASIAALEFAYLMAPKSAKGIIMGLFYLFTGVGSFIGFASMAIFQGYWFGPYDSGNINCRLPCTENGGKFDIKLKCHLDNYFFFLAGIEVLGLLLFLFVVKICRIQNEISAVVRQKSQPQIISRRSVTERLKSPVSLQRQSSSDISVT
ncbi:solute carrier family 15 member 4-like [Mytilus galloprovincialis]|uniref:solute carrier family 15 member 4-like n=1 Tax=Mytilus galloprovincialis TaxID=29158 RepID=UPI003F7C725C